MKKIIVGVAFAALSVTNFVACSSTPDQPPAASAAQLNNTAPTAAAGDTSLDPNAPVELKIVSPKPGEVVSTENVPVTFDLKNYHIEPNGQHIHVILDNEAYVPCYTTAEPFVLKDVKPGVHTIRAFPSRAWHESIKEPSAFADVTFYVEKKGGKTSVDFNKPMLTYSRPKGKYEGEKADKILFDFFLTNAELGPDKYKVKYVLDGQKPQIIDDWKPNYFENLTPGKHKLVVELINKNGHLVKGDYNKTEREFEVVK